VRVISTRFLPGSGQPPRATRVNPHAYALARNLRKKTTEEGIRMTHALTQNLRATRHAENSGHCGVCEAVVFSIAIVLVCLAMGPTYPGWGLSRQWLFTSSLLWACTSPAWLCRPNRYEIKRLLVGGTVAFACIAVAVFVGTALNVQLTSGSM
jgi:hypothetical protein